jgi:carboxymethylenebutenolidase
VASVLAGACPLVASYGAKDRGLAGAADKLRAALPAGVEADIKEYPDARHSFLNRLAVASPFVPVLKVAGVGYHHDSAADAKKRILAFFDSHLRRPAT